VMYNPVYLPFVTAIVLTALVVALVIALRWFRHKEYMASIAQGLSPKPSHSMEGHKKSLSAGLILSLTGLALTIGLITLGVGPWLLFGLLPLFIGLAFVLVSLVLAPGKPKEEKAKLKKEVIPEIMPEPQLAAAEAGVAKTPDDAGLEEEDLNEAEVEQEEENEAKRVFDFSQEDLDMN